MAWIWTARGSGGLSTCWVWGSGGLAPGGLGVGEGQVLGQLRGAGWPCAQPLLRAPSICCSAGAERTGGEIKTRHTAPPVLTPLLQGFAQSPSPGPAPTTLHLAVPTSPHFLTGCFSGALELRDSQSPITGHKPSLILCAKHSISVFS